MDQDDRLRLRKNYKLLVDSLTLDEVQDALVPKGILEQDLLDKINKEHASDQDKMRRLLRELPLGGPEAYKVFCDAIRGTGCHEYVLKALAATNVEVPLVTPADGGASDSLIDDWLRLKANYAYIVENVRYGDVRDQLYQDGALDDQSAERIDLMTTNTERERMRKALEILMKKSFCCSSFRQALKDTCCYEHVRDRLDKTDLESARKTFMVGRNRRDDRSVPFTPFENGSVPSTTFVNAAAWSNGLKKAFTIMSQDAACIKHWRELRVLKGLEESDVFCVENAYTKEGPRECVYQLLLCWQQKRGSHASIEELVEALEEMSLRGTAVKLRNIQL